MVNNNLRLPSTTPLRRTTLDVIQNTAIKGPRHQHQQPHLHLSAIAEQLRLATAPRSGLQSALCSALALHLLQHARSASCCGLAHYAIKRPLVPFPRHFVGRFAPGALCWGIWCGPNTPARALPAPARTPGCWPWGTMVTAAIWKQPHLSLGNGHCLSPGALAGR